MKKFKIDSIIKENKFKIISSSLAILTFTSTPVFATDNTYAKNASDWLLSGIQYITLAFVAFIIFKEITKRKFVQLIITIAISALVLAIVFNPSSLKTVGDSVFNIFFGTSG